MDETQHLEWIVTAIALGLGGLVFLKIVAGARRAAVEAHAREMRDRPDPAAEGHKTGHQADAPDPS